MTNTLTVTGSGGEDITVMEALNHIEAQWARVPSKNKDFCKKVLLGDLDNLFLIMEQEEQETDIDLTAEKAKAKEVCKSLGHLDYRNGVAFTHCKVCEEQIEYPEYL